MVNLGCTTCRGKKVKCDEIHPICGRCTRLSLNCEWLAAGPTLKERRRLQRGLRWRETLQPVAILSKDATSTNSQSVDGSLNAADANVVCNTLESHSADERVDFDFDLSSVLDLAEPSIVQDLQSNTASFGTGMDDNSYDDNNHTIHEDILTTWQDLMTTRPSLSFPTLFTSPVLSTYNTPLPSSIVMDKHVHQALDHYSTTFSMTFTKKHPKWSTLGIIKVFASTEPMLMHLLLAVSLRDLCWRGDDEELRSSTETHYRHGTQLLVEQMASPDKSTNHVSILISFWFLYLYKNKSVDVDVEFLKKLSRSVSEHVQRYNLDYVGNMTVSDQSDTDKETKRPSMNAKDSSLIALMITCLYYQDIKYGFYHCGGKLAKYLNTNKQRLAQVYDLGRHAHILNWAEEYPMQEVVDDTQNYAMLKLNNELNIILEDMNKEFAFTRHDSAREAAYIKELDAIKIRFTPVFALVDSRDRPGYSSPSPQDRSMMNADLSVAYYHAVRIYLFRCTLKDLDVETPHQIRQSVDNILSIALAMFSGNGISYSSNLSKEDTLFHRIEWPLFIAGVETKDSIHQDWIRQKLGERNTTVALERVLREQRSTGLRVGVETMRQVFCEDSRFLHSTVRQKPLDINYDGSF